MGEPEARALEELINVLSEPGRRQEFLQNPEGIFPGYKDIPQPIRDTLADLSTRELSLIRDINKKLCDGGFGDIVCIV